MSFNPLVCKDCNIECAFEQIGLFPSLQHVGTVGVNWKCPKCNKIDLDMCVLALNVPQKNNCLNCGQAYQDNTCQGCGLTKTEEEGFLAYPSKDEAAEDLYKIFNKGLIKRAFLVANYILSDDLSHEEAWKFKASGLNFLGLKEQRLSLFKDALAAGAPLSLLLSYGRALHDAEQFKEALDIYDKYLSLPQAEKKAVALCYKANSMVGLRKYDEAEKLFTAAIDADPQRIASYTDYINLLGDLEKWDKSLEIIKRLQNLSLNKEQTNNLLEEKAYIYAELGDGQQALDVAETVLSSNPKSARAHYLRGRALGLLGRLEEAQGEMKIVLEINPSHEDAANALKIIDEALAKTKPIIWKMF